MRLVLVDTNVLIDVMEEDERWFSWSADALEREAESSTLVINPIVYAEVAMGYGSVRELDAAVPPETFRREALPWEAAFMAAHVHAEYRRQGGRQRTILPDFFIGAHAMVAGMSVLTRDARRYRTYFPPLDVVAP